MIVAQYLLLLKMSEDQRELWKRQHKTKQAKEIVLASIHWLLVIFPILCSLVLRTERSLKSKMLSLARTSKYVNDTSVLSIKKSEEDS